MIGALFAMLAAAAVLLAAFYAAVLVAGCFPAKRTPTREPGRIAVLVPAHDEENNLARTIADLRGQLRPQDALLVVADNCTDGTAAIARSAGAQVAERTDPDRRGKGYALQFGLDALRGDPPEILCIVDADCRVETGAIAAIAGAAAATGRPAQALYLMRAPPAAEPRTQVAAFAWLLLNRVRMMGLYRLFDTARLLGSGMAAPWSLLAARNIGSGEIVEDLALGLDLARSGAPPVFCPEAVVVSEFPQGDEAAVRQRARWEHGSLRMLARRGPALLFRALMRGDIRLAATALDVIIPPLAVFGALLTAVFLLNAFSAAFGWGGAPSLAAAALLLFALSTVVAWLACGRDALPLAATAAIPSYLARKMKVYGRSARDSTKTWTRTGRDGESGGKPSPGAPKL
jgi:cellulose synthase/poly-beta-1,6-N-acetylglucosamine synthase-like glycosyltransferase